jgi:hypothetical protein
MAGAGEFADDEADDGGEEETVDLVFKLITSIRVISI